MLRVPVHRLQPGMVLARPIPLPSDPYRCLLQRDREIPSDLIPRLAELGIVEVWVHHRDLEFLDDLIDEGLADRQREVYVHVRRNFEAVMRDSSVELDLVHFQESVSELFGFLRGSPTSSFLLEKLDAFDNYLMSHSVNICYLALLVGMKLERYLIQERRFKSPRDAKDLHYLGLGCLLHDIGKMRISAEILGKPGKLDDAELAEMRRHTHYGYELVRGRIPAQAAEVVLNHHQRWDGTGYPSRIDHQTEEERSPLSGKGIPVFSRIAIIADVYDAATSNRCYSQAKLPVQVLHEMKTSCQGFFDPAVAAAFFRTVPPFPIGQMVSLSDGSEAVVVDFNPDFPTRPKVQCLRTPDGRRVSHPGLEELDLSFCEDVEISAVDGRDVRLWTSAQPPAEPALV